MLEGTTLAVRFERHYTIEPNSGCWLWTGALLNKRIPRSWRKKHAERRAQTHCKYDHPLCGDNLRIGKNGVDRICRACEALRIKKHLDKIGGNAERWRRTKAKRHA